MTCTSSGTFEEDNMFFRNLVDMVPAYFLLDEETKRKIRGGEENEEDDQQESRPKQRKRHKIDPLRMKTISQLQEELDQREEHLSQSKKQKKKQKKKNKKGQFGEGLSMSQNVAQLRMELQAKIAKLSGMKRPLSAEEIQEKRKLVKKNKNLKHKQKQNRHKGQEQSVSADDSPSTADMIPDKPVYNSEGKVVFSKFDFSSQNSEKPKTDLKGKNYKRLLEKLEKRKKVASLAREKGEDAASRLHEKTAWKTALLKAGGEKVKDNEQLLKKSLKRKERDKKKMKKSWESRKEQVDRDKTKKQNKRKQHLDSRKEHNKQKKRKKLIKKGRIIPGF